jgi:hypothetical protein
MTLLIRKSAALIAAYAIALQALLSGIVPAGQFGFDPFAVICSADGAGGHSPSLPQHRSECEDCVPALNSVPAVIPAGISFAPVIFSDRSLRPAFAAQAPSPQPKRRQPQASRAPPIAS